VSAAERPDLTAALDVDECPRCGPSCECPPEEQPGNVRLRAEVDRLATDLRISRAACADQVVAVARLTTERDAHRDKWLAADGIGRAAVDYAEREVADYDAMRSERDAARVELAELRERVGHLLDTHTQDSAGWDVLSDLRAALQPLTEEVGSDG
jgi:hypothetical protein